jgi:hypothetical protein
MTKTITYFPYKSNIPENFNFSNIDQGKYIFSVEEDKPLIHSGIITTITTKNKNGFDRSLIIYFDSISAQITSILSTNGRITISPFNEFFEKTKSNNLFRPIITNKLAPLWLESNETTSILIPKHLKRNSITRKFKNESINLKSYLYLDESTPKVIKYVHRFFILKYRGELKEDLVS